MKLSRRCSAPQWFIKASAVCLCNIMAPNLSLPQYCHNGSMCVVIHLNASDIIAGAPPPPLPTQTHTCIHAHSHPMVHIHTLAPSLFIGSIFRGTSSLNGWLDIFRSNNLSQVLRVALASPAALRTRCLVWESLCDTQLWNRSTHISLCKQIASLIIIATSVASAGLSLHYIFAGGPKILYEEANANQWQEKMLKMDGGRLWTDVM